MLVASASLAADFPTRPIELIVPYGPSSSDAYARMFAEQGAEKLGQPIVVVNRPGAGGAIGLISMKNAAPDGYTIAIAGTNLDIGYDPVEDFAPISMLLTQAVIVCVRADSPITTLEEYVAAAKADPGAVTFGTSGIGGSTYFAGVAFAQTAGIELTNVPINDGVMKSLLGGHVASVFLNTPDVVEYVRSGEVRALATTTATRLSQLPDVPTVAESGYPGFEVTSWIGVAAPKGTPPEVIATLEKYFSDVGAGEALQARVMGVGGNPARLGSEAFGTFIASETERWAEIAKGLHLQ
jgi:tripartite-type tricarboxylate transporter receptor subunit TctC